MSYDIVDNDIILIELFCIWIEDGIGAVENVTRDDLALFIEADDDYESNQVYRIRLGEDEVMSSSVKKVTDDPDCLFYEIDFVNFNGKFACDINQYYYPLTSFRYHCPSAFKYSSTLTYSISPTVCVSPR